MVKTAEVVSEIVEETSVDLFAEVPLGLTAAADCEAYKAYLIDVMALSHVKARYSRFEGLQAAQGQTDASNEIEQSSTTMPPKAGVDDMDILKANDTHIYAIEDNGVRIIKLLPASALQVTKLEFASAGDGDDGARGEGLLLIDNRLLVFRSACRTVHHDYPASEDRTKWPQPYCEGTAFHVDVYDLTMPAAPALLQTSSFDGRFNTAKAVNGRVYAVINNQFDTNDVYGQLHDQDLEAALPKLEAGKNLLKISKEERQAYMAMAFPIVRAFLSKKAADLDLQERLPAYYQNKNGSKTKHPLLSCQNIYLPNSMAQSRDMMSLIELSGDDFSQVRTLAVANDAWIVYASSKNFYAVASTHDPEWPHFLVDAGKSHSHIHRFDYTGRDGHIEYVNSGKIDGVVSHASRLNEYKGHLRVVTRHQTYKKPWIEMSSRLWVLSLVGPELKQVARIDDIAPGGLCFASLFDGNTAYLSIYRKTDLLLSLDLSTPEAPKVAGEMKISGHFSSLYLLAQDTLLTIAKDSDDFGRELGLHLEMIDVSDIQKPTKIHHLLISAEDTQAGSSSAEAYDHRAFDFHAPTGLMAIPMNVYKWGRWKLGANFSGMVILKASKNKGFEELGLIEHGVFKKAPKGPWNTLRVSRFMFTEPGVYDKNAFIYTLSARGIKVNNAHQPSEEIAKIAFKE